VQIHDDRAIVQASPDELPAIDINSLCAVTAANRRSAGNGKLERGLRRRKKNNGKEIRGVLANRHRTPEVDPICWTVGGPV
jgi:hypothetical protein